MMGGSRAHEFMVLNESARTSSSCAKRATTRRTARSRSCRKPAPAAEDRAARGGRRDTGHDDDRRRSATFLGDRRRARTAKAAFFVTGDGRLVTAIVRGDYEVNETKLANAVKAIGGMRPATVEEIRAAGMEPGYGSPIGATR